MQSLTCKLDDVAHLHVIPVVANVDTQAWSCRPIISTVTGGQVQQKAPSVVQQHPLDAAAAHVSSPAVMTKSVLATLLL